MRETRYSQIGDRVTSELWEDGELIATRTFSAKEMERQANSVINREPYEITETDVEYAKALAEYLKPPATSE